MSKGKLICIEGLDGSGKSTLVKKLGEVFPDFKFAQQPSPGFFNYISEDVTGRELQDLLDDNRRHCIYCENGTKNATDLGQNVIVDRYLISGIVHEYFELPSDTALKDLYYKYKEQFSDAMPDIVIYLDIEPELAYERVISRHKETGAVISRYENVESLKELGNIYEKLLPIIETSGDSKVIVIDASQPLEDVLCLLSNIIRKETKNKMENNKLKTIETIAVGATAIVVAGAIGYTAKKVVTKNSSKVKRTSTILGVGAAVVASTAMLAKATTYLVDKINK